MSGVSAAKLSFSRGVSSFLERRPSAMAQRKGRVTSFEIPCKPATRYSYILPIKPETSETIFITGVLTRAPPYEIFHSSAPSNLKCDRCPTVKPCQIRKLGRYESINLVPFRSEFCTLNFNFVNCISKIKRHNVHFDTYVAINIERELLNTKNLLSIKLARNICEN